ncbi:MAG: hypothetical protein RIQ60_688 [Pseudomonadota bacterium]|jgi:hypothetical protein
MLPHRLIDAVAAHLTAVLPVGSKVGTAQPRVVADLPAVVLSVSVAELLRAGLGNQVGGLTRGALALRASIDLANPGLQFGNERINLLSVDRRTLQLPHSPLVNADGSSSGALLGTAVLLRRGATTYTLVAGAPTGNQAQVDRVTGIATLGVALPATGTLTAEYFIGEWETDTTRFNATLVADVYASGAAALDTLSRQVAQALVNPPVTGLSQLAALGWPAMTPPVDPKGNTLWRPLSWRCQFEYADPRVITGGGPIRGVAVSLAPSPGALPDLFTVVAHA